MEKQPNKTSSDSKNQPSESSQNQSKETTEIVAMQYQGPIPPPGYFREYEFILPGSAERILSMAEKEQQHRINKDTLRLQSDIKNEEMETNAKIKNSRIGIYCAFVIVLIAIIGGVILVSLGKTTTGSIFMTFTLTAVVGSFIYGTNVGKSLKESKK